MFFLIGMPGVPAFVTMLTLFQIQAPDWLRGRMSAVLAVSQAVAGMLGAAVAGALDQTVSVVSLLTAQGAGYVLAAILLRALAGCGPDSLAAPTAAPTEPNRSAASPGQPSRLR